ncbi:B-cell receptor CD22-like [Engraulis encrasicolus]|uniref:B-cell receptor CD22-like n=1 Tax=Engraulis encrasicolus TaxID=184585 RepID=UPI002FD69BE1
MSPTTATEGDSVTLTCRPSCDPGGDNTFIWYKTVTSHPTISGNTLTLSSVSKTDAGSYSCALKGLENHPSPSVCVLNCWSVIYTPQSICVVKGSSVDLGCSYSYPNNVTVTETFWHRPDPVKDLSTTAEYANRVKYLGNKESNCSLRIEDLRENDAGEYQFRFLTSDPTGRMSGIAGVTIQIRTLQVVISPLTVKEGQSVTLTCRPSCDPGGHSTFIWYKNGRHVANQHKTFTISAVRSTDSGSYSCAVQGHEHYQSPTTTLVVYYPPKTTSALISPAGDIVEGDSVTLTCSSDANPPVHTYTWYKTNSGETPIGSGQNYDITNITTEDTGQYYYSPKRTSASIVPSGNVKEGDSVTLTCSSDANPPVHTYTWYKTNSGETAIGSGQNHNITNITIEDSGHYYCRANNSVGFNNSTVLSIDVFYPPKNTSLVLRPPGKSSEDSVTLACHSYANPPVKTYTWFKKTDSGPALQATGNISSLVLMSGDEGFYYCVVHNQYGSHYSPNVEVIFPVPVGLYAAVGVLPPVALTVVIVLVFVVYRRRKQPSTDDANRTVNDVQGDSSPTGTALVTSGPKKKMESGAENDIQYASVHFKAKTKCS